MRKSLSIEPFQYNTYPTLNNISYQGLEVRAQLFDFRSCYGYTQPQRTLISAAELPPQWEYQVRPYSITLGRNSTEHLLLELGGQVVQSLWGGPSFFR